MSDKTEIELWMEWINSDELEPPKEPIIVNQLSLFD